MSLRRTFKLIAVRQIDRLSRGIRDVAAPPECRDVCPITPLRLTPAVVRGDHKPRCCAHGEWTFAGTDYARKATKWRCPTGQCAPASVWVKADRMHPLIPRHTKRSKALYSSRGAVEREFGRLRADR